MITFYLVRHGEAENNVNHVGNSFPEKTKMHLTETGIEQVHATAEFLAGKNIDIILASPIQRTRETAEIISEKTGREVLIDDRLHETGMGIYNGEPIEKFFSKYPDMRARIMTDGEDGVESFIDMRGRLTQLVSDVKKVYEGKKVVLVSHGDVLDQLYGMLKEESIGQTLDDTYYPEKGSYKEVVIAGN
ncbi:MAG: histidine phosphatase family protein [Candidatus Moranbacteria bacterium]|nr:histidine phosphatase family protein [Candidatus Moranbacteria bacterium]MDD3964512.1 histidine phosphatase family protein [Candidatus Moranbacteria bacterium]